MSLLDYLLQKNKKQLISSDFQNTFINGKTICNYFNVVPNTKKSGKSLKELLLLLTTDLPIFRYPNFVKYFDIFKKYPEHYILVNLKENEIQVAKIKDIISNIEKYANDQFLPIGFFMPYPNVLYERDLIYVQVNKETCEWSDILDKEKHIEPKEMTLHWYDLEYFENHTKKLDEYAHTLKRKFSFIQDNPEKIVKILNREDIEEYKKLIDELNTNNATLNTFERYYSIGKRKCPKCGSEYTTSIQYGYPPPMDDIQFARHQVYIGGCFIGKDYPIFYCNSCKTKFGKLSEEWPSLD